MSPGNDRGRPGEETASKMSVGDKNIIPDGGMRSIDLDPFSRGVLFDAYTAGRARWWLNRAEDFERAKPVPGEYVGNASREQLSVRWQWCDQVARACRAKAEVLTVGDEFDQLLTDCVRWAA